MTPMQHHSPDPTELMHIGPHRDCEITHEICRRSSQIKSQHGGGEVATKPYTQPIAICDGQLLSQWHDTGYYKHTPGQAPCPVVSSSKTLQHKFSLEKKGFIWYRLPSRRSFLGKSGQELKADLEEGRALFALPFSGLLIGSCFPEPPPQKLYCLQRMGPLMGVNNQENHTQMCPKTNLLI